MARFVEASRSDAAISLVALWAQLEVVIAREAGRAGREPLGDRVAECWQAIEPNLPMLGEVVDASGDVPAVLAAVRRRVEAGAGLVRPVRSA